MESDMEGDMEFDMEFVMIRIRLRIDYVLSLNSKFVSLTPQKRGWPDEPAQLVPGGARPQP